MNKAVFLDRDGTIIVDKIYLNDPEQIQYLPGAFEALRLLSRAGYLLIVATNQSGVARGLVSLENLNLIHEILQRRFSAEGAPIAGFYSAPYAVESGHPWRKPGTGMLLAGATDHDVELAQSWMVGDRSTDVEAGQRAGTRTILLLDPLGLDPQGSDVAARDEVAVTPTATATSILQAAEIILSHR